MIKLEEIQKYIDQFYVGVVNRRIIAGFLRGKGYINSDLTFWTKGDDRDCLDVDDFIEWYEEKEKAEAVCKLIINGIEIKTGDSISVSPSVAICEVQRVEIEALKKDNEQLLKWLNETNYESYPYKELYEQSLREMSRRGDEIKEMRKTIHNLSQTLVKLS